MAEYIDREALLHDIEQSVVYTARGKITSAEMRGAHKIIERIKCAPAVEPIYIHEPTKDVAPVVHGRWDIMDGAKTRRICSKCRRDVPEYGKFYSYCPNCDARMDGGTKNAID